MERDRESWDTAEAADADRAVLAQPPQEDGVDGSADFVRTGVDEVAAVLHQVEGCGLRVRYGTALDFGCGAGRITRALAQRFERVVGIDAIAAVLIEARASNSQFGFVEFLPTPVDDLHVLPDGSMDFIYASSLGLESPRRQHVFLREFGRVLNRHGVLVFQIGAPARFASTPVPALLEGAPSSRSVISLVDKRGGTRASKRRELPPVLAEAGLALQRTRTVACADGDGAAHRYFAIKP
ncbi:MAG TPA: class I SAM-dependent methyltransferase [Burkholderiaceae bacterium]|nr:class I SAM-dependent methyltransferase [Burkholderiaceae bacterium]